METAVVGFKRTLGYTVFFIVFCAVLVPVCRGLGNYSCPVKCLCSLVGVKNDLKTDCSKKGLASVPVDIDSSTAILQLNNNDIGFLKSAEISKLRKLTSLNVNYCNLRGIEQGTFTPLTKLNIFSFRGNLFNLSTIKSDILCALNTTHVREFEVSGYNLMVLRNNSFECMAKLTQLRLLDNYIRSVESNAFIGLKALTIFKISESSSIDHLSAEVLCPLNLKILQINARLKKIPDFCGSERPDCPIIKSLDELDLHLNVLETVQPESIYCLQSLTRLRLNKNEMKSIPNNSFSRLVQLQELDLSLNRIAQIDPTAFNSSSLQKLVLNNNPHFLITKRNVNLFAYTGALEYLALDFIKVGLDVQTDASNDGFPALFRGLHKLQVLSLFSCSIFNLPSGTFQDLHSLEELHLGGNRLTTIEKELLYFTPNLKHLDLLSNRIATVSYDMLPSYLWTQLQTLDLQELPFACTCDLLWFRYFLDHTNITIVGLKTQNRYKCFSPPSLQGRYLLDFHITPPECFARSADSVFLGVATLSLLLVLMSLTGSTAYRGRWYLRYIKYRAQYQYRLRSCQDGRQKYTYDVFISYNREDIDWVRQELLEQLENKWLLRCCDHERDFLPGTSILANIAESMGQSRKVIYVITNAFQCSEFCQAELRFGSNENMVPILLEDIVPSLVTPQLVYVKKTTTYLEWCRNTKGRQLFWERLKKALDLEESENEDDRQLLS